MEKIIRIKSCNKCPFSMYRSPFFVCRHENAGEYQYLSVGDPNKIPDWCPLENVPSFDHIIDVLSHLYDEFMEGLTVPDGYMPRCVKEAETIMKWATRRRI